MLLTYYKLTIHILAPIKSCLSSVCDPGHIQTSQQGVAYYKIMNLITGSFTFEVRSRWNTPLEWRYAIPAATSMAIFTLRLQGNGALDSIQSSTVPAFIYCQIKKNIKTGSFKCTNVLQKCGLSLKNLRKLSNAIKWIHYDVAVWINLALHLMSPLYATEISFYKNHQLLLKLNPQGITLSW